MEVTCLRDEVEGDSVTGNSKPNWTISVGGVCLEQACERMESGGE